MCDLHDGFSTYMFWLFLQGKPQRKMIKKIQLGETNETILDG